MKKIIDYIAGAAVVFAAFKASSPRQPDEVDPLERATEDLAPIAGPGTGDKSWLARWKQVAKNVVAEVKEDNLTTVAAAMTYYGLLALFPALIAVVSMYGLVADPSQVQGQIDSISSILPAEAATTVTTQLSEIVSGANSTLGIGFALSLLATLWTVSSGVGALIKAINLSFDETETRSFLKLRMLSLGLTLGVIVFVVGAIFTITSLPAVLDNLGVSDAVIGWVAWLRWVGLAVVLMIGLGLFYRWAPNRQPIKWRPVTIGAVVATVLWLAASVGLNFYVSNFGSYNETYGTLGGVIVLLLWMYVSSLIVLVGAELDAELAADAPETASSQDHPATRPRSADKGQLAAA